MIKKRINCMSCETRCDVIITQSNFDDEEVNVRYCPVCSTDQDDDIASLFDDLEEYEE